ncbi:MAG: phosphoglucosamine mutase [Phycisphaerales bacterium]
MDTPPLMLSVSGARGVIGATMTPVVAAQYAAAFGSGLRRTDDAGRAPLVVVGRDSRPSGEMLDRAAVAGLLGVGCRVISLGVVTTPTVAVMIDELEADGGLVITASHNPIEWNGIKLLNREGVAPPPSEVNQVIARFRTNEGEPVSVDQLQPPETNAEATRIHVNRVLAAVDPRPIREARLTAALDSVNGAGGPPAKLLLHELGVEVIELNTEPTGKFAHTPEPIREHLGELAAKVKAEGAAVGFAQDPDADRLALVDERGEFIGEEYTLALAALHLLERSNGSLGPIVANLSTSRMVDDLAAKFNASVFRSPVGEANVVDEMKRRGSSLGGEGNGGVIWAPVCRVRDSLTAMALVLGLLAERRKPLSAVVAEIPKYEIHKTKMHVRDELIPFALEAIAAYFVDERVDRQDGVRIDFDERRAWLHVRPSNTEPIVRVIAEARSRDAAESLVATAVRVIEAEER